MWSVSAVFVVLLAAYMWLLLTVKHRASVYRAAPDPRERAKAVREPARTEAPAPRFVAEGRSTWARPTFNGLGSVGEGDRVHVVVRTAGA